MSEPPRTAGTPPGTATRRDGAAPILEAHGIDKQYGQVQALKGADFELYAGEVCALIGDNGAGKSTLIRILAGVENADAGTIVFDGEQVRIEDPTKARALGIETVFQDLALANHLDPIQNMFLGREKMRGGLAGLLGFMDAGAMRRQGEATFKKLGAAVVNFTGPVEGMSGGQRQAVAVARAAAWADRVIFFDEPTAALGVVQTKNVLDLVRRTAREGIGVVFISHSMPHVLEVADRIQVLRHGKRVATFDAEGTTIDQLVGAMTGALDNREETP
ncbi:MAG TPA: ATP-binding cassette domain-containing protein [Actinomycetaceae bacterium]|nr:ATP-binding cassette domain-containing protein [Actinomycetaceae bacterium]